MKLYRLRLPHNDDLVWINTDANEGAWCDSFYSTKELAQAALERVRSIHPTSTMEVQEVEFMLD